MKPIYLSKTVWMNLILAGAAFFPTVQVYLQAHPMLLAEVFAGVNLVLRLVTHQGISLSN